MIPLGHDMEISKYYNNPFKDNNDAVCYAEICPEEVDIRTPSLSPAALISQHHQDLQSCHYEDTLSKICLDSNPENMPFSESRPRNSGNMFVQSSQEELQHANNTLHTMQNEYENLIESLRVQLASSENAEREVKNEYTKLKDSMESSLLEKGQLKETLERQQKQNDLLQSRITELEAQLKSRESHTSVESATTLVCQRESSETPQPRRDPREIRPATDERSNAAKDPRAYKQRALLSQPTKPESDTRPVMSEKELETELLRNSQARDALVGQMQRLESLRTRTAATIRERSTTQKKLEEVEKEIGRIRLHLRSQRGHGR
ncbi:unnamed protein product [Phytomonas sp. Hart1]|nr:unnamed protein product [Phytomonas sp. Hart1]|eukprot:CCW68058.1 unnamed protein product [Phytomonas sp. isolate Hart1]